MPCLPLSISIHWFKKTMLMETRYSLSLLLIMVMPVAGADSLHVDPSQTCAAQTPCFATIQDAVNNATPDSQLRLFPATYVESVDISQMGSALGPPEEGNIEFLVVDELNQPTQGNVLIAPDKGASIFHSADSFAGDVVMIGLTVVSDNDDGIDLDMVEGDIKISNVTANGSGSDGIDVEVAGGFNITVLDSVANENARIGFNLDGGDASVIHLRNSTAQENVGDGVSVWSNLNQDQMQVEITDTNASSNGNNVTASVGVDIRTDGTVLIAGVEANNNVGSGITVSVSTNTTVRDSEANDNVFANGLNLFTGGNTLVRRLTAIGNAGNAVRAEASIYDHVSVAIECSELRSNDIGMRYGARLPMGADYRIADSIIAGNSDRGVYVFEDIDVNAADNWWGSATGPTHPTNPGGAGDVIADGLNVIGSSMGLVSFMPFREAEPLFPSFASDAVFVDTFEGRCQSL